MGLDIHGTKFVLYARSVGVSFDRTAMIGRHTLHLSSRELQKHLADFGYSLGFEEVRDLFQRNQGFAEPFLGLLGAKAIRSFDVSAYENATDIVDLNLPIGAGYKNRFTAALEGGTLEHVFNFPQAIKSCMEMLEVGGHFVGVVPSNNFLGHGFYQFSPELFFRVFSEVNGFKVIKMIVYEDAPGADWFEVRDPEDSKQRAELVNSRPTCLAVIAKRVTAVPVFASAIYQSDYVHLWEPQQNPARAYLLELGRKYMNLIPTRMRVIYRAFERGAVLRPYNPKVFVKTKIP